MPAKKKKYTDNVVKPPKPTFGYIKLENTTLHYVTCGSGRPLIIVPATVSLIKQWMPIAQFMGLRFKTYFFELPGHGKSTPYPFKFNSHYFPKTVEAFADALGLKTFNLMGFSFGGLLALRTLEYLDERIESFLMVAPFISTRALKLAKYKQWLLRCGTWALKKPRVQNSAYKLLCTKRMKDVFYKLLSGFSRVDESILRSKNAADLPVATLDVLSYVLGEILTAEYKYKNPPFTKPCFFAMSVNDDLLKYDVTEQIVKEYFSNLTMRKFYHPYHQPPEPPTFEWLMEDFGDFLEILI